MRVELFPFQKRALADIRMKTAEAMGSYHRTHAPQVVSFTAPTGAGKTIIMSALIEDIFFGDDQYVEQPDAIIVWLSDSPQLNEQSKQKIDSKADKIRLSQCVTVSEESFDKDMNFKRMIRLISQLRPISIVELPIKNQQGNYQRIP